MTMYREHVRRLKTNRKPTFISQRNISIGTNDTWFNALSIPRNPAWVNIPRANYVWSARNLTSDSAIISTTFRLSLQRVIQRATLVLSVDNYAAVLINGQIIVFDAPQDTASFFNPGRTLDVTRFLRRGDNDVVIIAFNFGGPRSASNPAGVAARLDIRSSALLR